MEVKLNELYESVDKFVIVESLETFKGHNKPLYFLENKERFSLFLDKIIHVVVEKSLLFRSPWEKEHFQRNAIMRGLIDCQDEDIIIIEDADEIVRASAIPVILSMIVSERHPLIVCNQDLYCWFLNVRDQHISFQWKGSVVCPFSTLKTSSPEELRSYRNKEIPSVLNGGWHFSYMGGLDRIYYKVRSFAHSMDEVSCVFQGHPSDILNRIDPSWTVPIDDSYPWFIRENRSLFYKNGFIF